MTRISPLVACPKCGKTVNNVYLRTDSPKCEEGHSLGTWVLCSLENHVYLKKEEDETCPFCNSNDYSKMTEGIKVTCMHETVGGIRCASPPFSWLREGPPCFMNHVGEFKITKKD